MHYAAIGIVFGLLWGAFDGALDGELGEARNWFSAAGAGIAFALLSLMVDRYFAKR